MSSNRKTVVLDTNAWIDYLMDSRPRHVFAKTLLDRVFGNENIDLCCFAGSIKDIYYIYKLDHKRALRNELGALSKGDALAINEIAWASIESIEKLITIIPCDTRTVWMARKLKGICSDFEDCLLLAACELADADFLVTNDERLQKIAPTKAADAETVLSLLQPFLD